MSAVNASKFRVQTLYQIYWFTFVYSVKKLSTVHQGSQVI